MMTLVRKYWPGLIALGILIMLLVVAILKTDHVTVSGTVLEKATTSDRAGSISHYIVIKSDDGCIEEKEGLHFCQYKVGDRIRYKTIRSKDLF